MRRLYRSILNVVLYGVLPAWAFAAGYGLTNRVFREAKIAFPFELFGIAAGAGFFFWALSCVVFFQGIFTDKKGDIR
jgi:hypothetical protein